MVSGLRKVPEFAENFSVRLPGIPATGGRSEQKDKEIAGKKADAYAKKMC